MLVKFAVMNLRWLTAVLIIHVLLWLALKPPVPHSDDKVYVEEGIRMTSSGYTISESPKSHRLLVIVPVTVFVKLFGHSPFVISLWPLLCSLLTIAGVFLLLRKNLLTALTSSLFISCNIIQVIYSTVAFPDAVVSLFAFMAIALIQQRQQHKIGIAFIAATTIVAGFFAKQIILLVIPFIIFIFREDSRNKMNAPFWKRFFAWLLFWGMAVLMVSKGLTGQWFFLIQSVEEHHNDVFVSLTSAELLSRLTIEPMVFIFSQTGYWPLLLMAWPAYFLKEELLDFWKRYAIILVLLLWFGTTSFQRWAPLPLLDRMWMMMVVPLSILASYSIMALLQNRLNKKIKTIFYSLFLLSAAAAFPSFHFSRTLLFLAFPLFFLMAEKRRIIKAGTENTLMVAMLPYIFLVIWFTVKNSNW